MQYTHLMSLHSPVDILKAHVGYNTGFFHEHRYLFPAAVEWAHAQSCQSIELSAHEAGEMAVMARYIQSSHGQQWLKRFLTVSVHGPTFGWIDDEDLVRCLRSVPDWIERIVLHPNRMPENITVLQEFTSRILIENMDIRDPRFHSASQLEEFLAPLPQARICLDAAHVFGYDPSMQQGIDILRHFGDRVAQLHVSGIEGYSHVPMTDRHVEEQWPLLQQALNIPWIMESTYG